MKKLLYFLVLGVTFTSCQKGEFEIETPPTNYEFEMVGRTNQDVNGYYRVAINPMENQQTLHRFGAYITNVDAYNLPSQVIWRCDAFWYTPDTLGHTYIEIVLVMQILLLIQYFV